MIAALSNVLAALHDNTAQKAIFDDKFTGNINDTIRFIFAIERYAQISNFQDPHSSFTQIYNALTTPIRVRIAEDRVAYIKNALDKLEDDASEAEKLKASKNYPLAAIKSFLITNYRPSMNRCRIIGQIRRIRMRYNENPVDAVNRAVTALTYASDTIKLLDSAPGAVKLGDITKTEKQQLLMYVFCDMNYNLEQKNHGGINEEMREIARKEKLDHDVERWKKAANTVVQKIRSPYYATDPELQYVWYPPIPLPLWETVTKTKKTPQTSLHETVQVVFQRSLVT